MFKFENKASSTGFTEVHIAGRKECTESRGVHRIAPDERAIEDAISVATRDGFTDVFLHTTKPLRMSYRLDSVFKNLGLYAEES